MTGEVVFQQSGYSPQRLFTTAAFYQIPMGVAFHQT
jgi:hypothetical protein